MFICVCSIARTGCWVQMDLTLLSLSIMVFEFEFSLSLSLWLMLVYTIVLDNSRKRVLVAGIERKWCIELMRHSSNSAAQVLPQCFWLRNVNC